MSKSSGSIIENEPSQILLENGLVISFQIRYDHRKSLIKHYVNLKYSGISCIYCNIVYSYLYSIVEVCALIRFEVLGWHGRWQECHIGNALENFADLNYCIIEAITWNNIFNCFQGHSLLLY